MAPRRSRRLSFPLLATLGFTCFGVTFSCSILTTSSCCVALPSTVPEFPGSTSWLAATLLALGVVGSVSTEASVQPSCLSAFVFSSWSDEAALFCLSQNRPKLVPKALPPPLLANLWETTNKSYFMKGCEYWQPGIVYHWKILFSLCSLWLCQSLKL